MRRNRSCIQRLDEIVDVRARPVHLQRQVVRPLSGDALQRQLCGTRLAVRFGDSRPPVDLHEAVEQMRVAVNHPTTLRYAEQCHVRVGHRRSKTAQGGNEAQHVAEAAQQPNDGNALGSHAHPDAATDRGIDAASFTTLVVERSPRIGAYSTRPPHRRSAAISGICLPRYSMPLTKISGCSSDRTCVGESPEKTMTASTQESARSTATRSCCGLIGRPGPFCAVTEASSLRHTIKQSPSPRAYSSVAT